MAIADKRGIPGAIIIGILATSIIAWIFGVSEIGGVVGSIPNPSHAFSMDFSLIATAGFIGTAFAFLFVDFFDTAGTLTSVANLTGKVNKKGEVEGIDRALLADCSNIWSIEQVLVTQLHTLKVVLVLKKVVKQD